jgi:hypothetical protein
MNKLSLKLGSVALLALSFYVGEGKAVDSDTFYCPEVQTQKGRSLITEIYDAKNNTYTYKSQLQGGNSPVDLTSEPSKVKIQFKEWHTTTGVIKGNALVVTCGYTTSTGTDFYLHGKLDPSCTLEEKCKPKYGVTECIKCGVSAQPPR